MKNLRVFNRIKYLASACFLTTGLVGHAFYPPIRVAAASTIESTVETSVEESKCKKVASIQTVEIEILGSHISKNSLIEEKLQTILKRTEEPTEEKTIEESAEEKEKRILKELRKEADPYASVYVSVIQNSLSFVINGTSRGQIDSDKFYQVFNEMLASHPEINYCYLFFKNYQNQIDFTRIELSDDVKVSISFDNSKKVKLDGILDNITELLVNNSSVEDLEELAKSVNSNDGFIGLNDSNQNLNSTIEKFFGSSDVAFNRVHLTWNKAGNALYLPALSAINADTISINYCGSTLARGELRFNENVDSVILYDISPGARIFVDDRTEVTLNYMDKLKEDILNCPTIRSLQNVDVGLYFAYGPEETTDTDIRIKITDKKCTLQTECEDWNLSSEKTEEGLWILGVTYSNQVNETDKMKILG